MNTNIVEKLFNKSRKVNFPDFTRNNGQPQPNYQDQRYYSYNYLHPMAGTASSVPTTVSFHLSQLSDDDDDNDSFLLDSPKETGIEDIRPKRVYSIANRTPSPIPIVRNDQDTAFDALDSSLYHNNTITKASPNQEDDTAAFHFTDINMYLFKSEPIERIRVIRRKPTPYSNDKILTLSDGEEQEEEARVVNLEALMPEISFEEEEQINGQEPDEQQRDKIKIKELKKLLKIQSKQLEYYEKKMKEESSGQLFSDDDEAYIRASYKAYKEQTSQQEHYEKSIPNAPSNSQYHEDYFHHVNYHYPYSRNHYFTHRHSAPAISSSVPGHSDNYLYYHYYQQQRHHYLQQQQQQQNQRDYMNFYHHYDHEHDLNQRYTRYL